VNVSSVNGHRKNIDNFSCHISSFGLSALSAHLPCWPVLFVPTTSPLVFFGMEIFKTMHLVTYFSS
jgi:hypothetical protein